jgi:hypothetical protein
MMKQLFTDATAKYSAGGGYINYQYGTTSVFLDKEVKVVVLVIARSEIISQPLSQELSRW